MNNTQAISFPRDFVGKKMICINEDGWQKEIGLFRKIHNSCGPRMNDEVYVLGGYSIKMQNYFLLHGWSKDDRDGFLADCFVFPENLTKLKTPNTKTK